VIILTDNTAKLPPLSERMKAIAMMVRQGETVADIGCDHGYISIWLCRTGISPFCIASDVNAGPVAIARKNTEAYNAAGGVTVRLGPGLTVLKEHEVQTAVIAGMGGKTITDILSESLEIAEGMKLILSPHSEAEVLRYFLTENGFVIEEEDFIKEDDKYYPIIRAYHTGEELFIDDEQAVYGPCLLKKKNKLLKEYILNRQARIAEMKADLSGKNSAKAAERITELDKELELNARALKYYE